MDGKHFETWLQGYIDIYVELPQDMLTHKTASFPGGNSGPLSEANAKWLSAYWQPNEKKWTEAAQKKAKKREEEVYRVEEFKRQLIEAVSIIVLMLLIAGVVLGTVWLYMNR